MDFQLLGVNLGLHWALCHIISCSVLREDACELERIRKNSQGIDF